MRHGTRRPKPVRVPCRSRESVRRLRPRRGPSSNNRSLDLLRERAPYLQVGSPSPAVETSGLVVFTPMPHEKLASWLCVFVASQAPEKVAIVGIETPVDGLNFMPFVVSVAYFAESEKYDSSAVTRLRRSDFIAAMYAFDLVLANFGIAIAARIPMITTTIRSSIRVKPLRMLFMVRLSPDGRG